MPPSTLRDRLEGIAALRRVAARPRGVLSGVLRGPTMDRGPGRPSPGIVRLRDVARIELGAQNYNQACTFDGNPSVGLSIYGGLPPRAGGRTLIEIPGQIVSRELLPIVPRISSEYFVALKIPLVLGRVWSPSETARGLDVGDGVLDRGGGDQDLIGPSQAAAVLRMEPHPARPEEVELFGIAPLIERAIRTLDPTASCLDDQCERGHAATAYAAEEVVSPPIHSRNLRALPTGCK